MPCHSTSEQPPAPAPHLAGPALEVGAGLGSPHLPLSTSMPMGSHPLSPPSLGSALHASQPASQNFNQSFKRDPSLFSNSNASLS